MLFTHFRVLDDLKFLLVVDPLDVPPDVPPVTTEDVPLPVQNPQVAGHCVRMSDV